MFNATLLRLVFWFSRHILVRSVCFLFFLLLSLDLTFFIVLTFIAAAIVLLWSSLPCPSAILILKNPFSTKSWLIRRGKKYIVGFFSSVLVRYVSVKLIIPITIGVQSSVTSAAKNPVIDWYAVGFLCSVVVQCFLLSSLQTASGTLWDIRDCENRPICVFDGKSPEQKTFLTALVNGLHYWRCRFD